VAPRRGSHRDRATRAAATSCHRSGQNGWSAPARYYPTTSCGFAHREPTVQRRPAHPKQPCDLLHGELPRLPQSTRRSQLLGRHHRRPAPNRPRARAASRPARVRPNQPPLKLSQRREDMQRQTPRRRRRVQTLGQRSKPNVSLLKLPNRSIRCRSDRPNRSSRHTTIVSPARK
jgi:hypothetical protein